MGVMSPEFMFPELRTFVKGLSMAEEINHEDKIFGDTTEFVATLEKLFSDFGEKPFGRATRLRTEQGKYAEAVLHYKAFVSLVYAWQSFYLETVVRVHLDLAPKWTRNSPGYTFYIERLDKYGDRIPIPLLICHSCADDFR